MFTRRRFLASLVGLGATAAGLAASRAAASPPPAAPAIHKGIHRWKMALTWQKLLPGLGTGAVRLANRIEKLSGGRLEIKIYGGGELVPPLGVFDAVSQGTVEMGHTGSYYWLNKHPGFAFFCTVPGGLTAQEQNAWLYFGGGLPLWHELGERFGLISFPAGNTGVQMGGWFKPELRSLEDLQGLKMRIPGLGGEVFARLGGVPQNIPPQELFTALQSGVIDALEWVGPWNDIALGFYKAAKHYYGPGFHEGGPTLELMLNREAFLSLPPDLQHIIKVAAAAENLSMEAEYTARNYQVMQELTEKHGVIAQRFPDDILRAFFEMAEEVVASKAEEDELSRRIYASYNRFRTQCRAASPLMERGFLNARG